MSDAPSPCATGLQFSEEVRRRVFGFFRGRLGDNSLHDERTNLGLGFKDKVAMIVYDY